MDFSVSRHPSTRFPFALTGIWSGQRSQPSVTAQTHTPPATPTESCPPAPPSIHPSEQLRLSREAAHREVTDQLENLVGHENVKRQLSGVQSWVNLCRRHGRDPRDEWYNIVLRGNPGTGKSMVARIYAKMLFSMGLSDTEAVQETTGTELITKGPDGVKDLLQAMIDPEAPETATAGVLIVDDPHHLSQSPEGDGAQQTLEYILEAMERKAGRVIVVFIGASPGIETFLCDSPRIRERICSTLHFGDFDRRDLLTLLWRRINQGYRGRMQVDGGADSPYMQVVARRLARGRGKAGFTNAHAVRDTIATVARRQAECLMEKQENGIDDVDYFFFSRQDLLGPSPADIRARSEAWKAIQRLVGQDAVKASVREVFDLLEENYQREIKSQRRFAVRMNRVFVGPAGTGKTTAAQHYARVLADLELVDNADVMVTSLAAMGKLSDSLKATTAKTLIVHVDNLQSLQEPGPSGLNTALDVLIQELLHTDDGRCVVITGPVDAITQLLPRLRSEAKIMDYQVVQFERFTREQLEELLHRKLQDREISISPEAFETAIDQLDNTRMRKDFDNAQAVERLLNAANHNFEERHYRQGTSEPAPGRLLQVEDLRVENAATSASPRRNLRYSVIPEDILALLRRYQKEMKTSWLQGYSPACRAARSFVFKGACGTGKRTVAQQLATLYYDMGILDTNSLVDCSVMDFVAPNLGQTSLRTRELLDSARGKLLFIEDAHRLGENQYVIQAMDELAYLLPKYLQHMVVILAGPGHEMDCLLANRPRLASLFQEELSFRNPTPRESLYLLDQLLVEEGIGGERSFLTDPQSPSYREFTRAIHVLSMFPCWDNVRDLDTLRRWMVSACMQSVPLDAGSSPQLRLSEDQAMHCMVRLYNLKRDRLRFSQDPKARALPRTLSQPRAADRATVRFPV